MKELKLYEKELERIQIFKGEVIDVHKDAVELFNGKIATREVVDHIGAVCVIATTEENEIFLEKQYRYPYKEVLLEVPAGKLEKDEEPLVAVKRELLEETGILGKNYNYMGAIYPTPGYASEKLHLYSCKVDKIGKDNLDDDEFLEVIKVPLKDAFEMVMSNDIKDAKTQIAILKYCVLSGGLDI